MATRKKTPPREQPAAPEMVAEPGVPVRLLAHDWPFKYSVLANGDLVRNQRIAASVAVPAPKARSKPAAARLYTEH